ncbi:hypothetical protein MTO96_034359 [Rhipicephalus appendiculatus]
MHTWALKNVFMGSRTSTMEPPLAFAGDSLPTAKEHGHATSNWPTQQEPEYCLAALSQLSFVPASNALEWTAARCSATPTLGYEAAIADHRGPSLFAPNDAACKSSRSDSKAGTADHGRTTEDDGSWKGVLFATTALSLHPNGIERAIAAPAKGRATHASAAERSSGEVTATTEELDPPHRKTAWRHRKVLPCPLLPKMCRGELGTKTIRRWFTWAVRRSCPGCATDHTTPVHLSFAKCRCSLCDGCDPFRPGQLIWPICGSRACVISDIRGTSPGDKDC